MQHVHLFHISHLVRLPTSIMTMLWKGSSIPSHSSLLLRKLTFVSTKWFITSLLLRTSYMPILYQWAQIIVVFELTFIALFNHVGWIHNLGIYQWYFVGPPNKERLLFLSSYIQVWKYAWSYTPGIIHRNYYSSRH